MSKKMDKILFGLFILSRILFLTRLPIFNDEAMYLHWGILLRDDPSRWTASLVIDGKQPGMAVLLGTLLRLPGDPLVLGRLVSVAFAIVTYLVTLKIARRLDVKVSLPVLSIFLIVSPYLLQYDRLALMESAVTACAVTAAYILLRWIKQPRLAYAVLFGAVVGLGWWFKSTSLLILVSGLLAATFAGRIMKIQSRTVFLFALLTAGTYLAVTLPLRGVAGYSNIALRERERVMSAGELLRFPASVWWKNIVLALSFLLAFITPVILGLAAGSVKRLRKYPARFAVFLFAFLPLTIEVMVSKVFTSRYLVIITPFVSVLAAATVSEFGRRVKVAATGITVLLAVIPSILLVGAPLSYYGLLGIVPPAQEDFGQYVRSFSSGYGVKEAVMSVQNESRGSQAIILVRADSGNPEDAVFVYADRYPNLRVGYDQSYLRQITRSGYIPPVDTFFISRGTQLGYLKPYLVPLKRFEKPFGEDFVGVYRLQITSRGY